MEYSAEEVMQFTLEEDVKFIRLTFCDVFGKQKNISIMPEELPRAFSYGIAFDASAISGFGDEAHSDLLLHPEPETLKPLPWRPEQGKVVQMFANISWPDGTPFECDTRNLTKTAIADAKKAGFDFSFGAEQEFYLFHLDENVKPTKEPSDTAGYMDIAPEDKGENVRREICLTLEQMEIRPESSHHEEGPGQNEIDFRYTDALTAADNVLTFQTVVRTAARRNGLWADFSPKPLPGKPGSGFHINMSVRPDETGKALGTRAIFTERENGRMTFRRGFSLHPGERVLIVEDIVTTGGSVKEVIAAVKEHGGVPVAVSMLVDRSGGKADFGDVPSHALLHLDVTTYAPESCPLCKDGVPMTKRGRTGK